MVIELPFELDTIDAIGEAQTKKQKIVAVTIRILPFFLHALCAIMEYFAYDFMYLKAQERIPCMKYFEISDTANIFIIMDYYVFLQDVMFAILGPFSIFMIYNNPNANFFNASSAIINIVAGILYHVLAFPCGTPGLGNIFLSPILSYFCGILHIILAVIGHMSFIHWDKEGEIYFGRIQDIINEKKKKKSAKK